MAKKRLDPTHKTLRRLYLASGGVCAMPGCNRPLVQPSGAWIGTVSHIVAAEDDGPRADMDMSVEDRRHFRNLVLFCATHGREVDDSETGAARYPVGDLVNIKREHEEKFANVIDRMLASATTLESIFADIADAGPRASQGLAHANRYLDVNEYRDYEDFNERIPAELDQCRHTLTSLSQPALDCLAMMLDQWERALGTEDGKRDYYSNEAAVHESVVMNRARSRRGLVEVLTELEKRSLVYFPHDEVDRDNREFFMPCPWSVYPNGSDTATCWNTIGTYLQEIEFGRVSSWLPSLDFSVFD